MPDRPVDRSIIQPSEPDMFVALPGLRDSRERARLTRQQLARRANASTDTIRSVEEGRRMAYLATARRIAEALGVSLDTLTGAEDHGQGEPSSP